MATGKVTNICEFFVNYFTIKKQNDKFVITTNKQNIIADRVIISTGSKSAPKTGFKGGAHTPKGKNVIGIEYQ